MDSMAEDSNKLHVAVFPWLAFGHILPFLELSKLLAQKGHRISFISTPRNIQRLPKIPQNLAPLINLVELPLSHQENLPRKAEATIDVPYDKIPYLKIAYDGLQESVEQFLKDSRPDWIVYDVLPHWLPPIAANLGISRVVFSIFCAWTICFLVNDNDTRTEPVHFTQPPQWVPFSTNVAFRLYEAKQIFDLLEKNNSGVPDVFRVAKTISGCDVFAIRSCMEIEEDWLDLLGEFHRKPIIPIGLLPPSADGPRNDKDKTWLEIKEWLNKQEKDSVIYVALGSEVRSNRDDINELALGLEQSGLPFFWALRKQLGSSSEGDSYELPEGFEKRVKGRGLVWTSWAPQQSILAHNSVGGFVTHCGWSSVVEALYFGLPFIMLPFILDQGLNARALAEKKLGVEIPRDEKNGSFTRTSMAESLKLVAVNEEGKIYREKAKEMQKMFGDENLHNRYFDKFEEHLLKYKSRVKILASDS